MVTGSMHLLEADGRKILLDCGLNQGKREEARQRNDSFPFDIHNIAAVIISHAHIDHCGNLPTLINRGYRGPIYCTPATKDLLAIMLVDSAKIQEEDTEELNSTRAQGTPPLQPLYTRRDVFKVLEQCVSLDFHVMTSLTNSTEFQFIEAGHILGSGMVELRFRTPEKINTLTFTGDLGRRELPLLRPTAPIPPSQLLVCESTYGNQIHESIHNTVQKLYETVRKTIERGGKVFIPAFSLGRTQIMIYYLQKGIETKQIPEIPIYVDSPLAAEIAHVYRKHQHLLNPEVVSSFIQDHTFVTDDWVRYVREFDESQYLSRSPDPKIVIASSGMCDAGRIVHYLKEHLDDPRSTVILVSYQAPGTTGRKLLEKSPTIRFQNRTWNKWIEVVHLDGFSGHADQADFVAYLKPLVGKIEHIRLIHGERTQAVALASVLKNMGFPDVQIPEPGDAMVLA